MRSQHGPQATRWVSSSPRRKAKKAVRPGSLWYTLPIVLLSPLCLFSQGATHTVYPTKCADRCDVRMVLSKQSSVTKDASKFEKKKLGRLIEWWNRMVKHEIGDSEHPSSQRRSRSFSRLTRVLRVKQSAANNNSTEIRPRLKEETSKNRIDRVPRKRRERIIICQRQLSDFKKLRRFEQTICFWWSRLELSPLLRLRTWVHPYWRGTNSGTPRLLVKTYTCSYLHASKATHTFLRYYMSSYECYTWLAKKHEFNHFQTQKKWI